MLVRFICKGGGSTVLFNSYALITYQKSRWPPNIENDRPGVNITVLIPMRDFAQLKILEVSAISWQYTCWSLAYLQLFFLCVCGCAMGLMSAIGPGMTSVG